MPVRDQIGRIDTTAVRHDAGRIRVALLGLGKVGTAVSRLAARSDIMGPIIDISGALVRDASQRPGACCPLTSDATTLFDSGPDVVVEVLGGTEPARQLVLAALERGIPVVTANKTLVAAHGEELLAAAERGDTALRYEAAVIAGVPFLGTLARRPLAGSIRRIEAVLNGTTNFVLSELEAGAADLCTALADAERRGFAEPDPSKDVSGTDAAEKLALLVRHLGTLAVATSDIPTTGIDGLTRLDLLRAIDFGGTLKPVAFADWSDGSLTAFVGPAFVPLTHPLSNLRGADNGIRVHGDHSPPVFFAGAGAGPDATAATILDDVVESVVPSDRPSAWRDRVGRRCCPAPLGRAPWFVRLQSIDRLPALDVADLFASYGVWMRRTSETDRRTVPSTTWLLTHPCPSASVQAALTALSSATGCRASCWPSLERDSD
jgi:homoserine dehydrogenase